MIPIMKRQTRRRRPLFVYITIIVTLISTVFSSILAAINIAHAISDTVEVSNQESFIQAINSDNDVTIKLTNNFVYDASDPLTVKNNIVFDGNGYTVTVQANNLIDEVAEAGSLTLNNASIRATKDDVVGTVYGKLVFHSTADVGIISEDSIVSDNYGFIQFDGGNYEANYAIIDYNENAEVIVNDGNFSVESYAFDDFYESKLEFHKGTVSAGYDCFYIGDNTEVAIYDGIFNSDQETIYIGSTTGESIINIHGGDFQSSEYEVIENNSGTVNIFGGTFSSDVDGAVYTTNEYGNGKIHLAGTASFSSPNDHAAFYTDDNSLIEIAEGYYADPADFLESGASTVKIQPYTITVTFISEDQTIDTATGKPDSISFPAVPTHSNGYDFLYWEDENGSRVDNLNTLKKDTILTAVFSNTKRTITFNDKGEISTADVVVGSSFADIPNIDRQDSGDGFVGWYLDGRKVNGETSDKIYQNLTLVASYEGYVFTYDELTAAISDCASHIVVGADIKIAEKVVINCDSHISSANNNSLIRADGYLGALIEISGDGTNVILENITIDGRNIIARRSAVQVGTSSYLELKGAVVQNNINNYTFSASDRCDDSAVGYMQCSHGGGILNSGVVKIYDGTKITNNQALSGMGGGIYNSEPEYNWQSPETIPKVELYIYGGEISYNKAAGDDHTGAGGGVKMDGGWRAWSTLYMYGGSIHHNSAEGRYSSHGGGVALGCGDLEYEKGEIAFYFYGGEITDNRATGDGGGVYLACSSMLMEGGLIARNIAGGSGGGIGACCGCENNLKMTGGVIVLNLAEQGGGIGDSVGGIILAECIYDNLATEIGDDIFYSGMRWNDDTVLSNNLAPKPYGEDYGGGNIKLSDEMKNAIAGALPTTYADLIDGKPAPIGVLIPFYGWYVDGERDGDIADKFSDLSADKWLTDNDELIWGDDNSVKAIWYGTVLLYEANDGTEKYQYDEQGYSEGANATVKDNLFERKGYKFIGWNTSADGTGTQYVSSDEIEMLNSQVLYAQWEKQSVIEDIIDDILNPTTGDGIIRLLAVFVVNISILASTVYYIQRR